MTAPGTLPPQGGRGETGTGVRVRLFARTDVGQVREHNEDNFLIADLTRRSRGLLDAGRPIQVGTQGLMFAVCDGMGGAAAGEIASQLAVDVIYEHVIAGLTTSALTRDDLARRLTGAIEAAGARIFREARNDAALRGMGTTVTAAALVDGIIFFAQVGDSRGYILREGELVQLTRDQSLANQLIEAGQLTEEEAETFEHNNIILQALGTAESVQVDLTFAELRRHDILLLCSDGLSAMVRGEEIRDLLLHSPEPLEICKALTEQANRAGGHDNITVVVAEFDGPGLPPSTAPGKPLRYRKYSPPDQTPIPASSHRGFEVAPMSAPSSYVPADSAPPSSGFVEPLGLAYTHDTSPHDDERIEIPGTRVSLWVFMGVAMAALALLFGACFLLLR